MHDAYGLGLVVIVAPALTGIIGWTSGLPFAVQNGANFPTNYDIHGFATQIAKVSTGRGHLQQRFADTTLSAFDFTLPGDSGTRNPLRGDGYFEIDAGLGKSFALTDRFNLKVGIEVFNVSNSVRSMLPRSDQLTT